MLVRSDQLDAFHQYSRKQFEARMQAHLRAKLTDRLRTTSDEVLRNRVSAGIDTAQEYGVEQEDDVELYLECMVTLGDDFGTNPQYAWAGKILRRGDLNGSAKMDRIHEHLVFEASQPRF